MDHATPHYLLFSDYEESEQNSGGRWHFILEAVRGEETIEASDVESDIAGERLELLAVVRGLEARDQPSRVTLVTPSRYVSRGIRFGLEDWRNAQWRWERHGRLVPVKNSDLWQRVDRALQIHDVQCRRWRIDAAHRVDEVCAPATPPAAAPAAVAVPNRPFAATRAILRAVGDGVAAAVHAGDRANGYYLGRLESDSSKAEVFQTAGCS